MGTSPVATTPSARKSSTSASTGSESSLTTALVFRASSCSTPSVVEPDPDSALSSSRDCPSTTARSPSSASPSTPLPKSPPPSLSPTTPSSQPTLSSSTPTSPSCSTTRLLRHLPTQPRHREAHLHQPQQAHLPGH